MTREQFEAIVQRQGGYRITLQLVATDQGGRTTPLLGTTEYRVNWSIGSSDPNRQTGGPTLIDAEALSPGEKGNATLTPLFDPSVWQDVSVGTELTAFEGVREVAHAVVTDVIPPQSSG